MGIETAIGGALAAGLGYVGYREQRKARKSQERLIEEQRSQIAGEREKYRSEQQRTNQQLEAQKKKIAIGIARSNRRRQRGSLFGESAQANQPGVKPTLG